MKSMKKVFIVSCLLVSLGVISGCNNPDNTEVDNSASNTNVTTETSSAERKKETKRSDDTESETMDLTRIQNGDYSSLLGEWEEVAISLNRHDGNGNVWVPSQQTQLLISKDQLSNGSMTMQGNTLNDGEDKTLTFSEEAGCLMADTSEGAIAWNLYFYPKGVVMSGWGEDVPEAIDSSKDRIAIRTSNNSYLQVFQRNSSNTAENQTISSESAKTNESTEPAEQPKAQLSMNLNEIAVGNFTSISGTWQNGLGQTIVVGNQTMEFSDITALQNPATISGLKLTVPEWDSADGTPNMVPYIGHDNMIAEYDQQLVISNLNGILSFRSELPGAALYISFLPKGIMGDIQGGYNENEKIVALGTQNNPTAVQESYVYYKVE
ncbi:DUF6287 domain-containing protein [Enterococcus sp. AZ109]|uniref:DUF6287 domain-containing protein n=1 Tax=Enterococcus sp. AZ109 TaxID=2774634 RepID=UPI003F2653B0